MSKIYNEKLNFKDSMIENWDKAPAMRSVFGIETTDNCPHIFGIGMDHKLYLNWRNSKGEWSGWIADWDKAPAMGSVFGIETTGNYPHIFGIGMDHKLYLNWRNSSYPCMQKA